jgi:fucose permease
LGHEDGKSPLRVSAPVRRGRLILAAILTFLVYGMVSAMLGALLPRLSERYRLTPEQNGSLAMVQALGLSIASISAGPLIDNRGKKAGLAFGLSVVTAALLALPNVSGYGTIKACWFTLGLGGGVTVTAGNALAGDISESARASLLNLLNLFFGVGLMATPFLAANALGGDAVKLCYVVAILTAGTLLMHVVTPMPPPTGERGFTASSLGALVVNPVLCLLALLLFLYVACEVGFSTWLARHLIAQGLKENQALDALTAFAFGILIGRVVVSRILIRVQAMTVILVSAILMSILTYTTLQITHPVAALIVVFSVGLAMAPVFPTTLGIVGDVFPKGTATAMGIVITCGWIGLAVSAPIIGAIAGSDATRLKMALLVFPLFSVLMVAVILGLRSARQKV